MILYHALSSTSISLPDDAVWTDQFWSPVTEHSFYGLAGDDPAPLIIKRNERLGRPLTIATTSELYGAIQYSTLLALQNFAGLGLETFTFSGFGLSVLAQFRYDEAPVSGSPVLGVTQYQDDEWWSFVIRLRIV